MPATLVNQPILVQALTASPQLLSGEHRLQISIADRPYEEKRGNGRRQERHMEHFPEHFPPEQCSTPAGAGPWGQPQRRLGKDVWQVGLIAGPWG